MLARLRGEENDRGVQQWRIECSDSKRFAGLVSPKTYTLHHLEVRAGHAGHRREDDDVRVNRVSGTSNTLLEMKAVHDIGEPENLIPPFRYLRDSTEAASASPFQQLSISCQYPRAQRLEVVLKNMDEAIQWNLNWRNLGPSPAVAG